ncbi:MAG: hypothetical protein E7629_03370 [Ruminococcaceae bacterium]|nr:hypothetical protein [Oscillospiraceae bacterium]
MKLDKRMVNRLLTLDDEQLGNVIKSIAAESGIDPAALGLNPNSIESIRAALGMAREEDLKQMEEIYNAYRHTPKKP